MRHMSAFGVFDGFYKVIFTAVIIFKVLDVTSLITLSRRERETSSILNI